MSDEEFMALINERYKGISPSELQAEDPTLYDVARKRKLVKTMRDRGILVGKHRSGNERLGLQGDDEVLEYVLREYRGKTLTDVFEGDKSLYKIIHKRKLVDRLVEEGVIVRKERKKKIWKSLDYTIETAKKMMEEHDLTTLPNQKILLRLGYSSLASAIKKYHGGFPIFRTLLGERQPVSEREKLEQVLRNYSGGNGNE